MELQYLNDIRNNVLEESCSQLEKAQSAHLHKVGQRTQHWGTSWKLYRIESLAIEIFRRELRGLKFTDLKPKITQDKTRAQEILGYYHDRGALFTANNLYSEGIHIINNTSPQQYFATCIKSEIIQKLSQKSAQVSPVGVRCRYEVDIKGQELNVFQDFVLPLIPEAPLMIHNLHFKTLYPAEYYYDLDRYNYTVGNAASKAPGKYYRILIGRGNAGYTFYKKGTVDIHASCSKYPYRIETEDDRFNLIAFYGQLQSGLATILKDWNERVVRPVSEWQLTECDINKDIKVSSWLQMFPIKINIRHLDHIFAIYIKSMSKDTVCRIEDKKHPINDSPISFINKIMNPTDEIRRIIREEIHSALYDSRSDSGIHFGKNQNDL